MACHNAIGLDVRREIILHLVESAVLAISEREASTSNLQRTVRRETSSPIVIFTTLLLDLRHLLLSHKLFVCTSLQRG